MKLSRFWLAIPALALFAGGAGANEELIKLSKDPNQWVMPAGNYANTRYSELNQINKDNVKNLRPLWTFSTGVLRGHEGGPLVIGDVMYVHAPFPNNVFALDLNKNAQILWKYEPKQDPTVIPVMCCDTVNRGLSYADGKIFLYQADTTLVALDAKTGNVVWSVKNGDPKKGETGTSAPHSVRRQHDGARQAGRQGFIIEDLARRPVEDRRRRNLGLDLLRSAAQPDLLWVWQSQHLESGAAAR